MSDVGSWWRLVRGFSNGVGRALMGVGFLYVALPEVREALCETMRRRTPSRPPARPLRGPGPGHPERVLTDLPLTALECRIMRDLATPSAGLPKTERE